MELHGVTGAPYKHPEVRKKLPEPYSRQRVDLDGGRRVKRSWKDVGVATLKKGDTVAGFGTVEAVEESIRVNEGEPDGGSNVWRVRIFNVMGDYQDFPGEQRVFAFAREATDARG